MRTSFSFIEVVVNFVPGILYFDWGLLAVVLYDFRSTKPRLHSTVRENNLVF
jgi:hypothetical protein